MKGVITRLLARSSLITLFTLLALSPMLAGIVHAQGTTAPALIPLPQHVERDAGEFRLTTATRLLIGDKSLRPVAKVFASQLRDAVGFAPAVTTGRQRRDRPLIRLELDRALGREAHHLTVGCRGSTHRRWRLGGCVLRRADAAATPPCARDAQGPCDAAGLRAEYYPIGVTTVQKLTGTPASVVVAPDFVVPPGPRASAFGMIFSGYLRVPEDGVYTFTVSSDDGSMLYFREGHSFTKRGPDAQRRPGRAA
jgi:hypothetical protein